LNVETVDPVSVSVVGEEWRIPTWAIDGANFSRFEQLFV
jgi:hypothetical protein